jgi:hypothetical protein
MPGLLGLFVYYVTTLSHLLKLSNTRVTIEKGREEQSWPSLWPYPTFAYGSDSQSIGFGPHEVSRNNVCNHSSCAYDIVPVLHFQSIFVRSCTSTLMFI